MPNLLKYPREWEALRQQYQFLEDFQGDHRATDFTATLTDLGTAAVGDAVNGILTLTPGDATVADNDEANYASANAIFKYASDKPFYGKTRLQFTETVAGEYNAFFGFANAIAADTMVDNGGGMRASGSIAAIYKVDGGTTWKCLTRNNGVVTDSTSSYTAGGTAYQDLEIFAEPVSTTQMGVTFRIDGNWLLDNTTGLKIVHTVTVASSVVMQIGVGAKLGAITNNVVLNVDYLAWAAQRTL